MKSPDDATAKVFDIVYDDYINKEETKKELSFIASQIKTNGSILDLGCGTGRHMIPLIKMGYTLMGLDNSKEMLNIIDSKLKTNKLKAETLNKNIQEITSFDHKFDGAICFWNAFTQMATNNKEAKHFFDLLFKSLKIDGKLIIEMTNPESFDPHDNIFKANVKKDGKTYETTYETILVDDKTHITKSNETVLVKKDGKVIEEMNAQIIQKWWRKEELTKLCKEAQFSSIEFVDGDYDRFKEPSEKLILVATR